MKFKLSKTALRSGLAVATSAAVLITGSVTSASAADAFDWKANAGETINIGFSAHPMSDALIPLLPEFEKLTGIKVKYEVAPEADFRAKLNAQLKAGSSAFDVYMTGPATNWGYVHNGWIENLQPYIDSKTKTGPDYDFKDFYPNAVNVNRWNGKPFAGQGVGPLYGIPMNEEGYAIMYRKDIFAKEGLKAPNTVDELIAAAKKLDGKTYNGKKIDGFVARGIDNWGPLITGYGTFLGAYGAKDLKADGTTAIATPAVIQATKKWVEIMKYAPKDVASYDWQQVQSHFAAGNAAIMIDADHMAATFEDPKASAIAGKVGYALPPKGPAGRTSGIWLWSLAMNKHSVHKDAAWYFIQWASSKKQMEATVEAGSINPPRASVATSKTMLDKVKNWGNYNDTWTTILAKYAKWRWQPSIDFDQAYNTWSKAVQAAILGKDVTKSLKDAEPKINKVFKRSRG
jgi:multiple sugar transport system substrate-binding protein